MELLLLVITALCSLSVLLTPCASQQTQVKPSHDQAQDVRVSLLTVPRKLRLMEESTAKANGGKELLSYNKQKGALSGKQHHEGAEMMNGRGGTRQEWVEGTDRSQFFTMDYSYVRRRRPIHNKSVPVGP